MKTKDHNETAIATLVRKRAEIAGIIVELEKRIAANRADLVHIDNALRLLNSPIAGEAIPARKRRQRNAGYFAHGELTRRIYDAMRERGTVSAGELADAAMRDKGITDKDVRAAFLARFLDRLGNLALHGRIERIREGYRVRWRLTDN